MRQSKQPAPPPYASCKGIEVQYEWPWKNKVVVPGDVVRFKMTRGRYRFRLVATNTTINRSWIDCIDVRTQEWRSFYVEKLVGVVKPRQRPR